MEQSRESTMIDAASRKGLSVKAGGQDRASETARSHLGIGAILAFCDANNCVLSCHIMSYLESP